MFKFSLSRRKANEIDLEIQELKDRIRKLEQSKKSYIWNHYFGPDGILLRKKLRNKKGR